MLYVFISGNIGAGKSTLLDAFATQCKAVGDWTFVKEPVDEWVKMGLLSAMYDGTLNPGEFQLMALATRAANLQAASKKTPFVMAERSPWEDSHVFAGTTLAGIHRVNYDYTHAHLVAALDARPTQIVHFVLEVRPEIALTRINSRARVGEQRVTLEYLQALHKTYSTFTPPGTVHRIDANGSAAATLAAVAHVCALL